MGEKASVKFHLPPFPPLPSPANKPLSLANGFTLRPKCTGRALHPLLFRFKFPFIFHHVLPFARFRTISIKNFSDNPFLLAYFSLLFIPSRLMLFLFQKKKKKKKNTIVGRRRISCGRTRNIDVSIV